LGDAGEVGEGGGGCGGESLAPRAGVHSDNRTFCWNYRLPWFQAPS
jgi:hypothetical protein